MVISFILLTFDITNNKTMAKKNFTKGENRCLTEVYRRLNYFHNGNVNTELLYLAIPSNAKKILELGLIKPHETEIKNCWSWYNLTELGKKFFSYYNKVKIGSIKNRTMFEGLYIKTFNYQLFEKLKLGIVK